MKLKRWSITEDMLTFRVRAPEGPEVMLNAMARTGKWCQTRSKSPMEGMRNRVGM